LRQWAGAFNTAFWPMATLVTTPIISGYYVYSITKNMDWFYGASILALIYPYTFLFIKPHYKLLLKENEKVSTHINVREAVGKWVNSHIGRLALMVIGSAYFLYAELKEK
jgi:hypothetical protein